MGLSGIKLAGNSADLGRFMAAGANAKLMKQLLKLQDAIGLETPGWYYDYLYWI